MAEITAAAVKALREKTDLPMMDCKKALVAADGDESKAIEILREQFEKVMVKRADNATAEGRIFTKTSEDGATSAAVVMLCESAPVAGSEGLAAIGNAAVSQLLTGPGADSGEALLEQENPAGGTLKDLYEETINKIREKIVIGQVAKVTGPTGIYVHHDGKTGVLFEAEGEPKNADILRDIAMHIAAMRPKVATVDNVDPALVQAERDRLTEEAKASGKPDNIIEKIVDGRMSVFYREEAGVLTEQPFAKEDSKTVSQILAENGLKAKRFTLLTVSD
ncbi:translation elongation factor Ts [Thalassoglobus polymorphus]|uniref:Elongation factor Ts n=1 Tax=Thalassoglobus polymorphus TaxID=2527994 RepID=A0A517QPQ6_9PLAN|nr:translation elongation factor Ts [Thalassoglobus polymorphus]QDT33605.1 Elongation factor Ts [Thalassoglobus polymorphus]